MAAALNLPPSDYRALAYSLSPSLFSRRAGIVPDPWQDRLLMSRRPRVLVNCSRQSGKSTTIATLALHEAIYTDGALVLMLSPTQRQSSELFRKALGVYRVLDRPVPPEAESRLSLELANGSRVVALPGGEGGIRGFSGVRLLVVDEASRVADALYMSVRPMLAVSGGRLIAASTPFGTRGWWYEAWRGDEPWERYEVPAEECPRISDDFLAEERRVMGEWWFSQEYLCNPPEAPIWMGDFSFQPLYDVKVGDTVIGWHRPDNGGAFRKVHLTRSQVLAIGRREADLVEVRMESGRVLYCTPDHKWLTMSAGNSQDYFVPAEPGKRLVHVIDPTTPLPDHLVRDAAWLGGIYDGEGHGDTIAQSAEHNPAVRARTLAVLESLGLHGSPSGDHQIYLQAQKGKRHRQALVDFLNWTQPTKRDNGIARHILGAHFRHSDRVVEVKPAGRGTVVSMQTTTGNYVAWGYASKNCQFLDAQSAAFREADIRAAFGEEIETWEM